MADAPLKFGFGTPFQEQLEFLRQKLAVPTQQWDDIQRSAHDRAFVVAGAAKAALLADLHAAVIKAAEEGKGLREFEKDFKRIVAKHGWTGWTGEGSAAGEAWRARIIYQTNMATSYAAGRYRQLTEPAFVALNPYWRYIHKEGQLHPREDHQAWHRLTLRHDHPFWRSHFPPNGWHCHCRVTPVTKAEGERSAKAGLDQPPAGWDKPDPKTGAPVGIDKGFDYAMGAGRARSWQSIIDDKLLNLASPIGAQMWEALKPALAQERLSAWQATFDQTVATMRASNQASAIHTVSPMEVKALMDRGIMLENAIVWMRDAELLHAMRDTKNEKGIAIPKEVWRNIPTHLSTAQAYLDTVDQALLYAIDIGSKVGKIVIRMNYNEKGRFDGVRARIVSNFVQTGGVVELDNIVADRRYVKLV